MKHEKLFGLLIITCLLALDSASAAEHTTIGSVADSLLTKTDAVTRLVHFVSIIVGCFLFIMAISLFRAHRSNPKFVPLERPVIYMLLGLVLVVLPFYREIFLPTEGANDLKKQEARALGVQLQDIDAPLEWGNDYDH